MKQLGFMVYIVCVNDYPWLTLTNLLAMPNLQNLLYAFSRPKYLYQVGFYRIVGHMVFIRNVSLVYGIMQCSS